MKVKRERHVSALMVAVENGGEDTGSSSLLLLLLLLAYVGRRNYKVAASILVTHRPPNIWTAGSRSSRNADTST